MSRISPKEEEMMTVHTETCVKVPGRTAYVTQWKVLSSEKFSHRMTQPSHYWVHTLRKPQFKKTYAPPMFIAKLFTTARTWKQPRCPLADEWIRRLWYIYTWNITQPLKRIHFNQF